MTEIEAAIRDQILTAIGWLGGSPQLLKRLQTSSKDDLYDAAEELGADRYLLAYIGSWAEDDVDVLADLREWNDGEQAQALEAAGREQG